MMLFRNFLFMLLLAAALSFTFSAQAHTERAIQRYSFVEEKKDIEEEFSEILKNELLVMEVKLYSSVLFINNIFRDTS